MKITDTEKRYEKRIREYLTEVMKDPDYAWNDPIRRDTLLCCIAIELSKIVDILEGKNSDAKTEN